jgi:hypothetical protein
VSRGYFTRRAVPDDRRRVMIELTERVHDKSPGCEPGWRH